MTDPRVLQALRRARERIEALEGMVRATRAPVAITGLACRLPGAHDPETLWDRILARDSAIGPVPADRWDADALWAPAPSPPGRIVQRTGGFLDNAAEFDADAFGIHDREADTMDPQHRWLLEACHEAIQRSAVDPRDLRGSRTGVYLGMCTTDWGRAQLRAEAAADMDVYTGTGAAGSIASGRLAYALGLDGPALTVDTACSSSLLAVHLAVRALRASEIDQAVVAGVNAVFSPELSMYFSQLGVLSPTGTCRPFDSHADGYVRAEGCVAVTLRRLDDAIAEGAPILAVIHGSATNQNGVRNGMIAPSGLAQARVVRAALDDAGVAPADVGLVEAMGSATPMGDLLELDALRSVWRGAGPVAVSAVKGVVGHSEGAAGLTSLIAAALAIRARTMPPVARPADRPDGDPLVFPASARPWEGGAHAGVSAFGFSGTNVHVVLGPPPERPAEEASGPVRVPLTARRAEDLGEVAARWADKLQRERPRLAAVAATAAALDRGPCRATWTGSTLDGLIAWLRSGPEADPGGSVPVPHDVAPGTPRWSPPAHPWRRRRFWSDVLARAAGERAARRVEDGSDRSIERVLLDAIAELVGHEVGRDDDLRAVGLDSLAVVELIQAVQRDTGLVIYPSELAEHVTVAHLAEHLDRARQGTAIDRSAHEQARVRLAGTRPPTRRTAVVVPEVEGSPPVFLLSAPRSGSTLLRRMLDRHPALFAPAELHLLPFDDLAERAAALQDDHLDIGLLQAFMATGRSEDEARAVITSCRTVPEAYARLTEAVAPRTLVDKSPSYGLHADVLDRAERWFPGCRYVHLVRHPDAVIPSFARLRMQRLFGAGDLDGDVVGEQAWAGINRNLLALRDRVADARWHTVRFEDLAVAPEDTLAALLDFLGLSWDEAVLDPFERGSNPATFSSLGDPGFHTRDAIDPDLADGWLRADPQPRTPQTEAVAADLGYPLRRAVPPSMRVHRDALLTQARLPADWPVAPPRDALTTVAVTGATGFLGAHLIRELLDRGDLAVRCVIRGVDPQARLREAFRRWDLDPRGLDRVTCWSGDLLTDDLGLGPAQVAEPDVWIHSAAWLDFTASAATLSPANVGGTRRVLDLAARTGARVHLVSSKGVFAPGSHPGSGPVAEEQPPRPIFGPLTGYQQSKWAAEHLGWEARTRGLRVAIHRPGRIVGRADGGPVPPDDLLVLLLQGMLVAGAVPAVRWPIEVVPVDAVARAIVRALPRVVTTNLVHGEPCDIEDLLDVLPAGVPQLERLPWADWRARVLADPDSPLQRVAHLLGPVLPARVHEARLDRAVGGELLGALPPAPSLLAGLLRQLDVGQPVRRGAVGGRS